MRIGAHVSIQGGFDKVPDRIANIGGNCGQIFVHSPQQWDVPEISTEEAKAFRKKRNEKEYAPIVVHCSYLLNLASHERKTFYGSLNVLKKELKAAQKLDLLGVVLHPGSHLGKGRKKGLKRLAKAINKLKDVAEDTYILVENMAGQGHVLGADFEDWAYIQQNAERENIGFCFDTCHAFAAGHAIHAEGLEETIEKVEEAVGWEHVPVIHLNDSKEPIGSNKDLHEHIGKGEIGEEGVKRLLNHPVLKDKPFVLETPVDEDGDHADNIARVQELVS